MTGTGMSFRLLRLRNRKSDIPNGKPAKRIGGNPYKTLLSSYGSVFGPSTLECS